MNPKRFLDGQSVSVLTTQGERLTGRIESAELIGIRSPGWIYSVKLDAGGTYWHGPAAFINPRKVSNED